MISKDKIFPLYVCGFLGHDDRFCLSVCLSSKNNSCSRCFRGITLTLDSLERSYFELLLQVNFRGGSFLWFIFQVQHTQSGSLILRGVTFVCWTWLLLFDNITSIKDFVGCLFYHQQVGCFLKKVYVDITQKKCLEANVVDCRKHFIKSLLFPSKLCLLRCT